MAMVMETSRRSKAVFVLYSYALVTRRCQPALAHSLLSATFQSGDVRTNATTASAAAVAADGVAKAGVANNATVGTNGTRQTLDKPGSSRMAGGHDEGSARLSVEQLGKRRAELEETLGGPVRAERERNHGQLVGSRGSSPDSIYSTALGVHGRKKGIKDFLTDFMQGTKLLWSEIILARKVSAKQKAGYVLTFQEQRLQRQVPRDVAKAFPLLVIFAVPFVGYLAPVMGLIFPKVLLPAQFWTLPQRRDYMLEDAFEQEVSYFPALLRSLATTASPPRPNSTPDQLRLATSWFENEGRLKNLSRVHLMRLVRSCNTIPPIKKASVALIPKSVLISWLTKEADSISDDDIALLERLRRHGSLRLSTATSTGSTSVFEGEGPGEVTPADSKGEATLALSPEELGILCWERGLLRSNRFSLTGKYNGQLGADGAAELATMLLKRLEEWLSLYTNDTSDSQGSSFGRSAEDLRGSWSVHQQISRRLPPSMVLHAAALLRCTRPAYPQGPMCHLGSGGARSYF